MKKGQAEVNILDQKKRTPLRSWRLTTPDFMESIRLERPHQTWKTFRFQKILRDLDSMSDLSYTIVVSIKDLSTILSSSDHM